MDMMNSALQYLREVRSTAAAGDGGEAYNQFLEALIQYRKRNIDSSIVISTAQTLFRGNPNLIAGFRHFAPRQPPPPAEITCAEFLNRVELRSCVDVVNRVGHRFNGGATYRKFLDSIHSYKIGETTAAAVSGEIAALFEDHGDLYREFARFLPELPEEEAEKGKIDAPEKLGLEKLKAAEKGKIGEPEKLGHEKSKAAEAEKGKRKIEEAAGEEQQPAAKRCRRRGASPEKLAREKLKATRENDMEDALCEIDVRIGRLKSARARARKLFRRLAAGKMSPAEIRARFTAVELVCVRELGRKFLEGGDAAAWVELMVAFMSKKVALERDRARIVEKWNRIRRS